MIQSLSTLLSAKFHLHKHARDIVNISNRGKHFLKSNFPDVFHIPNRHTVQQMREAATCGKLASSCDSASIRYLESISLLIMAFSPTKQLSPRVPYARHHLSSFSLSFLSLFTFLFSFYFIFYFHVPFKMNPLGGEESVGPMGHVSCNFHRVGGYPLFRITGSLPAPIVSWNRGPIATSRYVRTSSAC